jgi:hypothetical protein
MVSVTRSGIVVYTGEEEDVDHGFSNSSID